MTTETKIQKVQSDRIMFAVAFTGVALILWQVTLTITFIGMAAYATNQHMAQRQTDIHINDYQKGWLWRYLPLSSK